MARAITKDPLYDKAWKRTVRDTAAERDLGYGIVYDYKNSKRLEIFWDLSEEAKEAQKFMLKVDGKEYILDANQFMKYLRWV